MKAIFVGLGRSRSCGKSIQKVKKIHHYNSYLKKQAGELGAFLMLESGTQWKPRWGIEWNSVSVFLSADDSECFIFNKEDSLMVEYEIVIPGKRKEMRNPEKLLLKACQSIFKIIYFIYLFKS